MWQRFKSWCVRWLQQARSRGQSSTGLIGEHGERLAEQFLAARGFKVIARNWRSPNDRREEIDLVCRDGEVVVFVEVKARSAYARVSGYYSINRRKKAVLRRAATAYLRRLRPAPHTFRLDVIEVAMPAGARGAPEIRHFENVELFPLHFRP
jgi:putative endonuclease